MDKSKQYTVSGELGNILTKIGPYGCFGVMCEQELEKNTENIWKIKILKSTNYYIMVGVVTIDFDINKSKYTNCGWHYYCESSSLFSSAPYNYNNKSTNLKKVKNEITVVMDMNKRSLKFIIDNEDKGESYKDIPIDKPIFPSIFLWDTNDSVEIIRL